MIFPDSTIACVFALVANVRGHMVSEGSWSGAIQFPQ